MEPGLFDRSLKGSGELESVKDEDRVGEELPVEPEQEDNESFWAFIEFKIKSNRIILAIYYGGKILLISIWKFSLKIGIQKFFSAKNDDQKF